MSEALTAERFMVLKAREVMAQSKLAEARQRADHLLMLGYRASVYIPVDLFEAMKDTLAPLVTPSTGGEE